MSYKKDKQAGNVDCFCKNNIGVLTNKKCSYCGSKLYTTKANPNEHWCSNSKCKKGLPFGLGGSK